MRRSIIIPLALSAACRGSDNGEPPAPEPAPTTAPVAAGEMTPTVKTLMADHFTQATTLRQAVIDGEIETGKRAAASLAGLSLGDDLPEPWKKGLDPFMAAAKKGADASTLDELALATGELASACGSCHQSLGGPSFEPGDPPAVASGTQAHMQRHVWAVDRAWEGVVGPSDAAWAAGTDLLAEAPLTSYEMGKSVPPEVSQLATRVHDMGAKGNAITKLGERGQLVGELLGTCSSCHGAVRDD